MTIFSDQSPDLALDVCEPGWLYAGRVGDDFYAVFRSPYVDAKMKSFRKVKKILAASNFEFVFEDVVEDDDMFHGRGVVEVYSSRPKPVPLSDEED